MKNKGLYLIFTLFLLSVFVYYLAPPQIPVITYHGFSEDKPKDNMHITKKNFEKQMKFLYKHHYKTLSLEDIECFIEKRCNLPKKSVLITMDDGWKSELSIAAPILKKYNFHAVIFYVGENISGKNPSFMNEQDLETIQKDYPNIEIASHSFGLHYEEAYKLDANIIQNDMHMMKTIVHSPYFAYPYGKHSLQYHQALQNEKYELAFTFGPKREHRKLRQSDSRYELPRLNFSSDVPLWKFILRLIWLY